MGSLIEILRVEGKFQVSAGTRSGQSHWVIEFCAFMEIFAPIQKYKKDDIEIQKCKDRNTNESHWRD